MTDLNKSKYIRHVLEGRMAPEELDVLIDRTRKRLRELEHTHILDTQAISNLTVALERLVSEG